MLPTTSESSDIELQHIQEDYRIRDVVMADRNKRIWTPFNPANLLLIQQRERLMIACLKQFTEGRGLENIQVLDLGCGSGGTLPFFYAYGFDAGHLHGVDLLPYRIESAQERYPMFDFRVQNAETLPYEAGTFDILSIWTVMSSIFDEGMRQHVAAEALRVLKPGGIILWYDMKPIGKRQKKWQTRATRWLSFLKPKAVEVSKPVEAIKTGDQPKHRGTKAVSDAEIARLFPGCDLTPWETGLYLPVGSLLTERHWLWAEMAARLGFLKTHTFAQIRKPESL